MVRTLKQPRPQPQAANTVSDYESDFNQANLDHAPLPPPSRTNTELNLSVIKRHLPDAISIVSIASYAVVYTFSPTTQQWEKNGVEGTLFICELTPSPSAAARYTALVLNRRGLDNFVLELLDDDDVDITEEYVILQGHDDGGAPKAYGLWIFSEPEPSSTAHARETNAKIMKECASEAKRGRLSLDRTIHSNGHGAGKVPVGGYFPETQAQENGSTGGTNARPAINTSQAPNPEEITRQPDILGELFRKATQTYRGSN